MKVCFLIGTLGRGGAERQLLFRLRSLEGTGIEPHLLCLTRGEGHEADIRQMGLDIAWVGQHDSRLARLFDIRKAVRRINPEIVESIHFYTNIYAALGSRLTRATSIGAIRSNVDSELSDNGIFGRWHLQLPNYLIANSETGRRRAIVHGVKPDRVFVLPNAVALNPYHSEIRQPSMNGTATVLFAGRLVECKRLDRFFRVVAELSRSDVGRRVRLLIAGDGLMRSSLDKLIRDARAEHLPVEILGEASDMAAVYRRADVLLLSSDFEGSPNVVIEAMANGLPVVATRVGGVDELIGNDRGLLAEREDEVGLMRALATMISNDTVRGDCVTRAREFVMARHTLDGMRDRMTKIYEEVNNR